MPIEASSRSANHDEESVAAVYLAECRATLGNALTKIEHCLDQHQIVYIPRLRLGDAYRFQWAPATPEQGSPA